MSPTWSSRRRDMPPQTLAAGRRRGCRPGRLLRPRLGRAEAAVRAGVSVARGRFIIARRRGGGRQVDPGAARSPRRCARAGSTWSSRASPAAATAPRRSATCCCRATVDRWSAQAEALLFAAARADHVEKMIQPALERGTLGDLRPLRRSARSPIRAARAGSAMRRCARCTASDRAACCPTGRWCSSCRRRRRRARAAARRRRRRPLRRARAAIITTTSPPPSAASPPPSRSASG